MTMTRHKKALKIIGWTFGSIIGFLAVIIITLQLIFTGAKATELVNKYAADYIDGNLNFGKVTVNFLRHFPKATLNLDDVILTYPADKFKTEEEKWTEAKLLLAGKDTAGVNDTLASFDKFSIAVNLATLMTGTDISLSDIILTKPRIFAKAYNDSTFNWNIVLLPNSKEQSDTTQTDSTGTSFSIDGLSLKQRPHIIFSYPEKGIAGVLDVRSIDLKGKVSSDDIYQSKMAFNLDSLYLAGRFQKDTIFFAANSLKLKKTNTEIGMNLQSELFASTTSTGRVTLPFNVEMSSNFTSVKDTSILDITKLNINLAHIPLNGNAQLKFAEGGAINIKGDVGIHDFAVATLIDKYGHLFLDEELKVATDAKLSLNAHADGNYCSQTGEIPSLKAELRIPESKISSKFTNEPIELALNLDAATEDKDGVANKFNADLRKLSVGFKNTELIAKGSAKDLLSGDPSLRIEGNLNSSLDSLLACLTDTLAFKVHGRIKGDFKGKFRLSDITGGIDRIAESDLHAHIQGVGLEYDAPIDTMRFGLDTLNIYAQTMGNIYDKDLAKGTRVIALMAKANKVNGIFKSFTDINANKVDIKAQNSVLTKSHDGNNKNKGFRPFSVIVSAGDINATDNTGMSVSVSNTNEIFKIYPKQDIHKTPVIKVIGTNRELSYKDDINRVVLNNLDFNASAVMNTWEKMRRQKAFVDSLRRAYPGKTDEDIKNIVIENYKAYQKDIKKNEDFKDYDIKLDIDKTFKDYYKNWNINGGISLAEARLITPMLPLKNSVKNVKGTFNNNEVKISTFEIESGKTNIVANANLTGLRKLIYSNGLVDLDMNVTAKNLHIDELISAFYTGQYIIEQQKKTRTSKPIEKISDEDYMKMLESNNEESSSEVQAGPIVIPGNIKSDIKLAADHIVYSGLSINNVSTDIAIQDRCMQLTNTSATTDIGSFNFEGFYCSWSKKEIMAGINLEFKDITAEKVIEMIPAADTLMPLLKAFKGKLSCEMAATSNLDTDMNFIIPTLNGIIRITGNDMKITQSKEFKPIAKLLNIKTNKDSKIKNMSVEALIADSKLEIFPFTFELDKYRLAMSGIQYLDMSFKYHITVLKSPFPFRLGLDFYGPDFDHMKFKLGKPKYKNNKVPVFTQVIDETKINLTESIHEIFRKGVAKVLDESRQNQAIKNMKQKLNYIPAVELPIDSLNTNEKITIETLGQTSESINEIITIKSNEQSRVY